MTPTTQKKINSNNKTIYRSTRLWYVGLIVLALLLSAMILPKRDDILPMAPLSVRIQGWINALMNPQLTAERHAAQAQLERAGDAAVDPLLKALQSDNVVLRRNSADMFSYLVSPRAKETLLKAMNTDPDAVVRENAAWALGELGDVAYWQALNDTAVLDHNAQVRATAQEASHAILASLAQAANLKAVEVSAFATVPVDPNLIYLTSRRDLVVSRDGGKTWETFHDVLPSQVLTLMFDPKETNVLYAGVDAMGIYKSVDSGMTWQAINNGLDVTPGARVSVTAIAIDEMNSQRIVVAEGLWIGTNSVQFIPLGIFQSVDGGATWQLQEPIVSTRAITHMILKGDELYAVDGDYDVLMMAMD